MIEDYCITKEVEVKRTVKHRYFLYDGTDESALYIVNEVCNTHRGWFALNNEEQIEYMKKHNYKREALYYVPVNNWSNMGTFVSYKAQKEPVICGCFRYCDKSGMEHSFDMTDGQYLHSYRDPFTQEDVFEVINM